jgi:large subunit ribosomal protein L23
MNNYRDIIKAPIVTEKSANLSTNEGKYVFKVAKTANKTAVKQAIETIFKVKVESVNIINLKPKKKRFGLHSGKTNHVKKAIVKLAEGNKIDFS